MSKSAAFPRWIFCSVIFVCVMFINDVNCFNQTTVVEQDYCLTEYFSPSCPAGDIIMKSAKYGRMEISRCISSDYGYLGCSDDVLPEADQSCSGRQSCQIPVANEAFLKKNSCPQDFSAYLKAGFECVKVETADSQQCDSNAYMVPSSPISGIISSYITEETDKGSYTCPWLISVNPGQKINITLYNFATEDKGDNGIPGGSDNMTLCRMYAVIKERTDSDISRVHSVCGGGDREKTVYIGEGQTLEITIVKHGSPEQQKYFLLKYEVSGDKNYGNHSSQGKVNNWIILLSGMVIGITVLLH